jgi:uncharacterized SAM-binding protein YcdF (DUF218 family)
MIRLKRHWVAAACLALPLTAYFARGAILREMGSFLVVMDPPEQADFVFLLNGDVAVRPPRAAELVKQGYAPKVVVCRAEDGRLVTSRLARNVTEMAVAVLQQEGLSQDQIVQIPVPGGVTSTFDEAVRLREYAAGAGARRVLVVTSSIHTRRSRWIIRRQMPDGMEIRMIAAFDPRFDASNWWLREEGFLATYNEYLKLVYYLARHW